MLEALRGILPARRRVPRRIILDAEWFRRMLKAMPAEHRAHVLEVLLFGKDGRDEA